MLPDDAQERAAAVFAALTDPTRRALLNELAIAGPATVTELAARVPVTRQAVAKHLAQLADAGLVMQDAPVGRRHPYRLDAGPIRVALTWLSLLANEWDNRLSNLEHMLDADR
jgi:DNA-binding transcriptional ArsR family regulator